MSLASLDGITVTSCRVQLPAWGVWYADVEIDQPTTLAGPVTLTLADLALKGTIVAGGAWQGRARYTIAAGAGAWGAPIAARHYGADNGVKASKVLTDVAADCGETLGTLPASLVGTAWTRESGPASLALELLYPAGWYVDEAGVTQIGARAASIYDGAAARISRDDSISKLVLASDSIAGLLPGVSVDGVTAIDVEHAIVGGKLRTTIWGGTTGDRRLNAMRAIVERLTANLRYRGVWEYRVVRASGERWDLQCVRKSTGLPDLRRVRARPGVAGCKSDLALGSLVLVSFVNGDPSRPVVIGFDDAEAPGFVPTETTIDADDLLLGSTPRKGVARKDDLVVCGGFGGTITTASTQVESG